MKIVVSITEAEARQLLDGKDLPDLGIVQLKTSERGKYVTKVIVEDRMHRFYQFEAGRTGPDGDGYVVLQPVERVEHTTYTYRLLP